MNRKCIENIDKLCNIIQNILHYYCYVMENVKPFTAYITIQIVTDNNRDWKNFCKRF